MMANGQLNQRSPEDIKYIPFLDEKEILKNLHSLHNALRYIMNDIRSDPKAIAFFDLQNIRAAENALEHAKNITTKLTAVS
jgi:hypothetical protein